MALLNIFTVWGQKETLKFNQNRTFKIVQFTDVHYKYDDQVNSQVALDRMNEVLDIEKPEFVIFTGDVVVSNESFKGLDIVLDVCIKRNIPLLSYLVIMTTNTIIPVRNSMTILRRRKAV